MHICIIGPGAVGVFLAAHLAQYEQVTLVGRNITALARQEVRVVGVLECQSEVTLSPHVLDADLVMVTTKAIHLEAVIPVLKQCRVPVIFWQNGLGINRLARTGLPGVPLLRGLIWMGVVGEAPYRVRCSGFSRIAVGALQNAPATSVEVLQASLMKGRLATEILDTATLDCAEWEKSLWNIAVNGLCAITGERNGVVIESPHLHEILVQLIREAQAVARAVGCNLDLEEAVVRLTRTTATNVNSMLQDMRAGRRTEIDFLNGYVMRLGNEVGISTPCNTAIYHLVKHIEARGSYEIS